MSKPVFEDFFGFSGRRNRLSYMLYHLTILCLMTVAFGIFIFVVFLINPTNTFLMLLLSLLFFLSLIPFSISILAVSSQRVRDFGVSGWAALAILLPVVGGLFYLALFFIPGNPGENDHGPDPLGRRSIDTFN